MSKSGIKPTREVLYRCVVCGSLFRSRDKATAEFNPPNPFPKGTIVSIKLSSTRSTQGRVTGDEIRTNIEHTEHRRIITVDYGLGVAYFYISKNEDESVQLELAW